MPTDLTKLFRDHNYRLPAFRLIDTFPITLPDGMVWKGSLWTENGGSKSNRRIQVHDAAGVELFDSDTCYDSGNARNHLELWLSKQLPNHQPAPAAFSNAGAGI